MEYCYCWRIWTIQVTPQEALNPGPEIWKAQKLWRLLLELKELA